MKPRNNILLLTMFCALAVGCRPSIPDAAECRESATLPSVFPLYNDVTIPPNIAPLDFELTSDSENGIYARIEGRRGGLIETTGKRETEIPEEEWRELLRLNRGSSLTFTVCTRKNGEWIRHKRFSVDVSNYEIDHGVTFREIIPGYSLYTEMHLTQHALETSDESHIFSTTNLFEENCINCHTTNRGNANQAVFHVRSSNIAGGTIIRNGSGSAKLYDMKSGIRNGNFVYPYWHPEGRYIAFSQNGTAQQFPYSMKHRIEVFDTYGMIAVYDTKENRALRSPLLNDTTYMCNCPAFSADGRKLYFCLSRSTRNDSIFSTLSNIKYNLCSIDFNPRTGEFGNHIDTIVNAERMGKSVAYPRPSYDGKYILYSLADYGYFGIHHPESDLWVYDIAKRAAYPLKAVNSPRSESFHNWSSNSHWIVFSSRRYDGYTSHLYFASVDSKGRWTKPFIMPRKHPYTTIIESPFSESVPEFITAPVELDKRNTIRILENNIHTKIK